MTSRATAVRRRLPQLAILLIVALLLPLIAFAQPLPGRTFGVNWRDGVPYLSFSARDLATTAVRRKLDSGLPQNIVLRVAAYRPSDTRTPVAGAALSCRVTNDMMERRYRVQVPTPTGDEIEYISTLDGVIRRCLEVRGMRVDARSGWRAHRGERVRFAVLIEFNPLSRHTVEQIRRWLANSSGGPAGNDAFFGSFVSVFVSHRVGSAERALRFQSQPVRVP